MKGKKHFFLLFTFSLVFSALCYDDIETLKFVNILYRHGDRSPIHSYPSDPHNETDWPQGYGQLTEEGMLQEFTLGKWLRARYDGFIDRKYKRLELRVQSTDYDRTLQSAQSNLAGLYSHPDTSQVFAPNLTDWIPVPVFSYYPDINTDPFAGDRRLFICPKYIELNKRDLQMDPLVAQVNLENKDFYAQLSSWTGVDVKTFLDISFFDTLFCQKQHNLAMPKWADDSSVLNRMDKLTDLDFSYICKSEESCRLKSGMLVKTIVEDMKMKVSNSSYPTLVEIYSAHDSTLATFQSALKIFNGIKPPYACALMLELHEKEGKNYVQIYLRNSTSISAKAIPLSLPNCEHVCEFNKFISLVHGVMPVDLRAECGIHTFDLDSGQLVTTLTALALLFFLLLVLTLFLCLRQCHLQRRDQRRQTHRDDVQYSIIQDTDS